MADRKKNIWNFFEDTEGDKVVWIIVLMLIMISVLCIFSSTSRLLLPGQTRLDLVKGHLFIVLIGLAIIIICYNIKNINFFRICSKYGFLVSFILLTLLLSHIDVGPIKSVSRNGARRIIEVYNQQIHVNEVVKVAMVMYLAWAVDAVRRKEGMRFFKGDSKKQKYLYVYMPFILITLMVLPGSNSAALFTGGIMFLVILLGGDSGRDLLKLLLLGIAALAVCMGIFCATNSIHKKNEKFPVVFERIGTGISRFTGGSTDYDLQAAESPVGSTEFYEAIDKIRQPYSAKIAVHQGSLIGKGPGQSTQRYVVPDISEDYMFSFIIEEYGILGGLLVITLYLSLLARSSIIVRNCGKDLFAKLTVAGLSLLISCQAFLHICVNVDIGPMTGQTLPLVSHGAFAFLCFSVAFGVILSISRIASNRIAREQRAADPLVDLSAPQVENDLADLDAFESGNDINEQLSDDEYGI